MRRTEWVSQGFGKGSHVSKCPNLKISLNGNVAVAILARVSSMMTVFTLGCKVINDRVSEGRQADR